MATAEITRFDRSFLETSSSADLLSQLTDKEQRSSTQSAASRPKAVPRSIPFVAGSFHYVDNGEPRPVWLVSVLQGFANLVTLPDNWDGEGAPRINRATIRRALAATERLLGPESPAPSIVPLTDGGLQIEWHRNQRDLEIEFIPNGRVEFYFFDENTKEEHEGPVGPNFAHLEGYLERIR